MAAEPIPRASTSTSTDDNDYPEPTKGASLILAFRPRKVLILGSGPLAASRAFAALEADAEVHVLARGGVEWACDELRWRAGKRQLKIESWGVEGAADGAADEEEEVRSLEAYLNQNPGISLACITDTLLPSSTTHTRRSLSSTQALYTTLRAHNIPVNTADIPSLCDFTFTSTHRFVDSATGKASPLQVGVTTNGQGCRLAGRLRREIVAKVPSTAAGAVLSVGKLRALAKAQVPLETQESQHEQDTPAEAEVEAEEDLAATPNRPVPLRSQSESEAESARRRMRWVAQISEYWPLSKLAALGGEEEELKKVLEGEVPEMSVCEALMSPSTSASGSTSTSSPSVGPSEPTPSHLPPSLVPSTLPSQHGLPLSRPHAGRIFLLGSGPGHPSLLTVATHAILTRYADLVLADKLVPDAVLQVIPKGVEIRIAKKFPGNAEGAQKEMMEMAVEAARRGLCIVRLKQGDPVIYGRAGEEVLYFRAHGLESTLIPGISSAIAAPMFAGIPVTQRGAAESLVLCTGVGRGGKEIKLPGYDRGRTTVILMGVARLAQVVASLTEVYDSPSSSPRDPSSSAPTRRRRDGPAYPSHTPIAIIERASMPDQRVIYSTLENIVTALERSGEQRPPGMIVVGWAVLSLGFGKDVVKGWIASASGVQTEKPEVSAGVGVEEGGVVDVEQWGKGDVGVLDEGAERDDVERVRRWLGDRRWRVVEGVDEAWETLL